jgi:signal transduction protein with GAF and PtsI domain
MADLDERARAEEVSRAQEAKRLLDNALLNKALDDIEHEVLTLMENTHDDVQILKLHRMYVCSRKFRNTLRAHIETGKLAAFQLEEKRKFKLWRTN